MHIITKIVQEFVQDLSVPFVITNERVFMINEVVEITCTNDWAEPIFISTVLVGGLKASSPCVSTKELSSQLLDVLDRFIAECERDYDRIGHQMRWSFDQKKEKAREVRMALINMKRFEQLLEEAVSIFDSWVGIEQPRIRLMGPSHDELALVLVDGGVHIETLYLNGAKVNMGLLKIANEELRR